MDSRSQKKHDASPHMPNHDDRLRAIAEKCLPMGARLIASGGEGYYVMLASWKLGTDPARPHKRSKTLRIVLTQEALDDYARGAKGERNSADARFEASLRSRLSKFNPSHDAPLGSEPPIEKWDIGTIELNG